MDNKFTSKKEKLTTICLRMVTKIKDGRENKRFFIVPFKDLLKEISQNTCETQQKDFFALLNTRKGQEEQIDDICVMGIRI